MQPADCNAALIEATERVWNLAISPDGKTIASAGRDGTVKIWNSEPPASLPRFPIGPGARNFRFLDDCRTLITLDDDHFISRWKAATGSLINRVPIDLSDADGWTAFSPDGRILAVVDRDRTFSFWNTRTGHRENALDFKVEHATPVFSPNGRYVTVVFDQSRWCLWDLEQSRVAEWRTRATFTGFAPSSEVVIVDDQGSLHWWNPTTGQTRTPSSRGVVPGTHWAVSLDGRTLAIVSATGRKIDLWNSRTLEHQKELVGHVSGVNSMSFDPQGKTLASASSDRTLRLWNLTTGEELLTIDGFEGAVAQCQFSCDGEDLGVIDVGQTGNRPKVILFRTSHDRADHANLKQFIEKARLILRITRSPTFGLLAWR